MTVVWRFDFLAGPGVPLPHRPVRRGGDQARAVRSGNRRLRPYSCDLRRWPAACRWLRPTLCCPIDAARGDPRSVRAEREGLDSIAVSAANCRLLAGNCVEHHDRRCRPWTHSRVPSGLTLTGAGSSSRGHTAKDMPRSSSKSKAEAPTHAATRRPRRVWVTAKRSCFWALAALSSCSPPSGSVKFSRRGSRRQHEAGPGRRAGAAPTPGGSGISEEVSSSRLYKCRHSHPRRASGRLEVTGRVGHVVVLQCRAGGGQRRPGRPRTGPPVSRFPPAAHGHC